MNAIGNYSILFTVTVLLLGCNGVTNEGNLEDSPVSPIIFSDHPDSTNLVNSNTVLVSNESELANQDDSTDLFNGDNSTEILQALETDISTVSNIKSKKIILDKLAAFPTAHGVGAIASGGRGGDVVYVTNRNSHGAGSFRHALTNANPKKATTILFAIGGQFDIGSHPTDPEEASIYLVGQNNITIAGQTANDIGGVNIMSSNPKDGRIYLSRSENLIFRYTSIQGQGEKFQYGGKGKLSPMTLSGSNTIILDHYTGGYASYGVSAGGYNTITKKASGVTIQNSLFHENVGNHNVSLIAGMLVSKFDYDKAFPDDAAKLKAWKTLKADMDLHHNAYILNDHRQPGNLEGGEAGSIKAISNYIYGWGERTTAGAGSLKVDLINNLFEQNRAGSVVVSKLFKHHFEDDDKILAVNKPPKINPSYYLVGNQILENNGSEFLAPISEQWHTISDANTHRPISKNFQRGTPQKERIHPIPVTATADVKQQVLKNAGAGTRYHADGTTTNVNAIDSKYISIAEKKSGPDELTNNVFPYDHPDGKIGDPSTFIWPDYISKKRDLASYDNDRDGLPDGWEMLHKVSEANAVKINWQIQGYEIINNAGYTNLEIFLAELAGDFHMLIYNQ
ncbi:MAG: hypothetical protein V3U71_03755 [Cocleimonas sp.]